MITTVKQTDLGFAYKIDPCTLRSYEGVRDDIADRRNTENHADNTAKLDDLVRPWLAILAAFEPSLSSGWHPSQDKDVLGQSFTLGIVPDDHNPVLWHWGENSPHKVRVFDPSWRLPKDQLSWR
jgi:RES domain-containing protein